jgi:hypothetical protein
MECERMSVVEHAHSGPECSPAKRWLVAKQHWPDQLPDLSSKNISPSRVEHSRLFSPSRKENGLLGEINLEAQAVFPNSLPNSKWWNLLEDVRTFFDENPL